MPGKTFKITPKHRRFVKEYINGKTPTAAGRLVGFSKDYSLDLVKKPIIVQLIQDSEKKAGLTDELLTRAHVELIQQDTDRSVRLGAVRLGYQVNKKIGADTDGPVGDRVPQIFIVMDEGDGKSTGTGRSKVQAHKSPNVSIQITD